MLEKNKIAFLLEPDVYSRRIILHTLKEKNLEIKSFNNFNELTSQKLPSNIAGIFISAEAAPSVYQLKKFLDEVKALHPDIIACVISNSELKKFPCNLVRPLSANFINRKLTVEFFKQECRPKEPTFNFVGVAIAASTGGPLTLQHFFSKLSYTDKAAFFMVMHAPDWMLASYAERLNQTSPYLIRLAENNDSVEPGNVYIAPGDFHMRIDYKDLKIKLTKDEPYNFLRPAADPMFFSVAEVFGKASLGIVFTGMGHDGTLGAGKIKAAGGKVIVQSPDTAVIHSMPNSVIEVGCADKVVPIENMHQATIDYIRSIYKKI